MLKINDQDPQCIKLEQKIWGHTFKFVLLKNKGIVEIESHDADYECVSYETYEYQIKESKVLGRAIERSTVVPPGRDEDHQFTIKDGIVQEEAIKKNRFFVEFTLEQNQRLASWSELNDVFKHFILYFHPELFPRSKFHQLIRDEIKRISAGTTKAVEALKSLDYEITQDDNYILAKYKREDTDASIKAYEHFLTKQLPTFGINNNEWTSSPCLLRWLRFWSSLP